MRVLHTSPDEIVFVVLPASVFLLAFVHHLQGKGVLPSLWAAVCLQTEHCGRFLAACPCLRVWDPPVQNRAVGAALSVVLQSRGSDQLRSEGAASAGGVREGNSFVAVVALNRK